MKLKLWLFYHVRLSIGRIQKCPQCKKHFRNSAESLHWDLYMESTGVPKKTGCHCRECSRKSMDMTKRQYKKHCKKLKKFRRNR